MLRRRRASGEHAPRAAQARVRGRPRKAARDRLRLGERGERCGVVRGAELGDAQHEQRLEPGRSGGRGEPRARRRTRAGHVAAREARSRRGQRIGVTARGEPVGEPARARVSQLVEGRGGSRDPRSAAAASRATRAPARAANRRAVHPAAGPRGA